MSTEYSKHYYCDEQNGNGQVVSAWPQDIKIDIQLDENGYIKKEIYNQMFNALVNIHNFGQYDSAPIRLPDIANKITFSDNEIIPLSFYNDIAQRIWGTNSQYLKNQHDLIYGSYFSNLKQAIETYKLPKTRYYQTTYECCSCDGYTCSYCPTHVSCGNDYYCSEDDCIYGRTPSGG